MSADDARRRFDEATRTHLLAPLPGGVEVEPCSAEDWQRFTDPWWASGQDSGGRYYMQNTILLPAWRGRGLYRGLLASIEATVRDSGFLEIWSRHRADNNAVIIPKLRAGWVIAAFEVGPKYGLLVHLRRYLNDGLGRAFGYRVDGRHVDALRAAGVKLP